MTKPFRLRPRKLAEVAGDDTAERLMRELGGRRIPRLPATHERNKELRDMLKKHDTYREAGESVGLSREGAYRAANGYGKKQTD